MASQVVSRYPRNCGRPSLAGRFNVMTEKGTRIKKTSRKTESQSMRSSRTFISVQRPQQVEQASMEAAAKPRFLRISLIISRRNSKNSREQRRI